LGSLRTLTILLALGAWGAATEGAPPDDKTSPSSGGNRAPLPAPPIEYLKGGIRLFNTGDQAQAAKYLKVANDYRDQLSPTDVAQLDSYLSKLSPAPTDMAVKPASSGASTDPASTQPGLGASRGTSDPKSEARWKLQSAKELLRKGNYDEAMQIVLEVQKMNIKWGLFEETPTKLAEAIAKARPKATASAGSVVKDKKAAQARLKEAKELLNNKQFEQAEAIALEVKSWGLSYGMFEEKPEKIAAAAKALRRRDESRNTSVKAQPSPEQYDILVSEARHYVATGQYDLAEARANQALRMQVYPTGTADRAEAVLSDIAVAKAKTGSMPNALASNTAPGQAPFVNQFRPAAVETPSLIAEREANELLAKGKQQEAAAKFVEAQNLRDIELRTPVTNMAAVPAPVVDRSVKQVTTVSPAVVAEVAVPAAAAAAVVAAEASALPNLDTPTQSAPAVPPVVGDIPAVPSAPAGLPVLGGAESAPMPIADPASPPVAMPAPEAAPLMSALPSVSTDAPPPGNKGEELLAQA
jgi:tetratricopeptide (TPR) repeat protein